MQAMTTEQLSMPAYTTSLDSPINLGALEFPQATFDRQEPLANHVTRTNEMRKVMGSNRGSASSLNLDNFSTGHVTPDSVTTSGAATPYTYPHDRSALHSPADATFNHVVNMNPRYSNGYTNGTLPHIAGARGDHYDWSGFQNYPPQDDFTTANAYHSGSSTPHHIYNKPAEPDFGGFDWNMPQQKP